MADPQAPASKRTIIELLVLVFSHSEVKDLVGTDALRSVLAVRYQDMIRGNELHFEPLWSLLVDQPEFDPAAATPAVCRFKLLEKQIGVAVVLPESLEELDTATIEEWGGKVELPPPELKAILHPPEPEAPTHETRSSLANFIDKATHLASEAEDESRKKNKKRKRKSKTSERMIGWEVPLAIVAVIGLGFASYTVYNFAFKGPAYESVQADFSGIPVTEVKKLGDQVGGVLTGEQWLSLPREQRQQHLSTALMSLQGQGVRVVYVSTADGKVRAVASLKRNGEIRYEFQ